VVGFWSSVAQFLAFKTTPDLFVEFKGSGWLSRFLSLRGELSCKVGQGCL